jgi:hypothetical protein
MNHPFFKQPNVIDTLAQNGYQIYTRPYELNIIGVRNSNSVTNKFDDYIFVCYQNTAQQWETLKVKATTEPGLHFINKPMNANGTAVLKQGQYKGAYQLGMHRGRYKALVQRKPVTVFRTPTGKADITSINKTQTGQFGINIHHAKGDGTTEDVNRWSAGCQVIANIDDFRKLMNLAEQHAKLYGNSFTYTLIDYKTKGYKEEQTQSNNYSSLVPIAYGNTGDVEPPKKQTAFILLGITALVGLGTAIYFLNTNNDTQNTNENTKKN